MRVRIAAIFIAVVAMVGVGAAPAAAGTTGPECPPVLYPFCG